MTDMEVKYPGGSAALETKLADPLGLAEPPAVASVQRAPLMPYLSWVQDQEAGCGSVTHPQKPVRPAQPSATDPPLAPVPRTAEPAVPTKSWLPLRAQL